MAPSIYPDRQPTSRSTSASTTDQLNELFDRLSREWFGDEHPATARVLTDAIISSYLRRRASPISPSHSLTTTPLTALVARATRWLLTRQSLGIAPTARARSDDRPVFRAADDRPTIGLQLCLLILSSDR